MRRLASCPPYLARPVSLATWRAAAQAQRRAVTPSLTASCRRRSGVWLPPPPPAESSGPKRTRGAPLASSGKPRGHAAGRSRSRPSAVKESADDPLAPGLSRWVAGTVKPETRQQYDRYRQSFLSWAKIELNEARSLGLASLDRLLMEFVDVLFDRGAAAAEAEKTLGGIVYVIAETKRADYNLTCRAIRGFTKMRPPTSRVPIPEELTSGLAAWAASHGFFEEALLFVVMHYCYFRPGEAKAVRPADVVVPTKAAQQSLNRVGINIAPQERGVLSKTQTFDETVRVDYPPWLGALVARHRDRRVGERLFECSHERIMYVWKAATAALGVPSLVQYQLRHGGASGDYLEGRRTLNDIALRGRWKSMNSVRRYTKAGQVQKVLNGLDGRVRAFTSWAHEHLERILGGDLEGCPGLPHS